MKKKKKKRQVIDQLNLLSKYNGERDRSWGTHIKENKIQNLLNKVKLQ